MSRQKSKPIATPTVDAGAKQANVRFSHGSADTLSGGVTVMTRRQRVAEQDKQTVRGVGLGIAYLNRGTSPVSEKQQNITRNEAVQQLAALPVRRLRAATLALSVDLAQASIDQRRIYESRYETERKMEQRTERAEQKLDQLRDAINLLNSIKNAL